MVYNNGFGVKIITDTEQDKLQRGFDNYVALHSGSEYSLRLTNDRNTDAMAEIFIEGDKVGTWLIPAKDSIIIDRPINVARKFTFFKETNYRAISAGVIPGNEFNGVIKAIFYPKKEYGRVIAMSGPLSPSRRFQNNFSLSTASQPALTSFAPQNTTLSPRSLRPFSEKTITSTSNYSSGATVLGSHSHQTFGEARRFSDDEIDWNNKTTIILRLIVKPNDVIISTASSSRYDNDKDFISIKDMASRNSIPPRIDAYRYFI